MLLDEIARASTAVGETRSRLAKIERIASCLSGLNPAEVPIAVAYLSGELPHGAIGVGWASLRDLPDPAPPPPTIELLEVDAAFRRIAKMTGSGSQELRRRELAGLYGRATEPEQQLLTRLLLGELRQGALEGIMVEAVARAADVPAPEVRRALMLSGDLGAVAAAALLEGRAGLSKFHLTVLRPMKPMLAQTADDLSSALDRIPSAAIDWKLDGARIQVHRLGQEVRAFTRSLADVTSRLPEVVEAVQRLPSKELVLDGEAVALKDHVRPHPFQVTMGRFGSSLEVEQLQRAIPISGFFFDCLHIDGEDLIDRPAVERFGALADALPEEIQVPRLVTNERSEANEFFEAALQHGHEGVMVKALDAHYEAGRRGASWLKVKRTHTLDLVVLAVEWGHGRRRGWLSNLHLGARDEESGGFVMLGKTFKGMTDEMLEWQTQKLLELEERREGIVVYVRPELVVEVAIDGVQVSTRYPGGVALRFARVKGYRPDKSPREADTIEIVRAIQAGNA